MNTLSVFNPSFADSFIDVLDKELNNNFGIFAPIKGINHRMPTVDVIEKDTDYIMQMDLPGYTEKDVEIGLKDRTLTISSCMESENKSETKDEEKGTFIIRERNTKHFMRRFTLPEDINGDNVSAKFENGVLTINIPKKPDTQPRQIEIKRI